MVNAEDSVRSSSSSRMRPFDALDLALLYRLPARDGATARRSRRIKTVRRGSQLRARYRCRSSGLAACRDQLGQFSHNGHAESRRVWRPAKHRLFT